MKINLTAALAVLAALVCAAHLGVAADAPASVPAIKAVAGVTPNDVEKAATATKPLVLDSEKAAAAYFRKDELAKLTKEVDFTKQVVLVFAWSGSGGDKLDYTVAESFPEQITFTLTRGRTRDFVPHVYIYALRSNVKWSAK